MKKLKKIKHAARKLEVVIQTMYSITKNVNISQKKCFRVFPGLCASNVRGIDSISVGGTKIPQVPWQKKKKRKEKKSFSHIKMLKTLIYEYKIQNSTLIN